MFEEMIASMRVDVANLLMGLRVDVQGPVTPKMNRPANKNLEHRAVGTVKKSKEENISRNAPCPCGSGKKYKNCCGK